MKELIPWLVGLEELAAKLYHASSHYFSEDRELRFFLNRLAADEIWHGQILKNAQKTLERSADPVSDIHVDADARARIEKPLTDFLEILDNRKPEFDELISFLYHTEFSEWNAIFLYVINSLKEQGIDYQYVASEVQEHLSEIKRFFSSVPAGTKYLKQLENLPKLWTTQVLVVDDSPVVLALHRELLTPLVRVDTAVDGREALDKLKKNYYNLIISDFHMPVMDGRSLFQALQKSDPYIAERFLFITGRPSKDVISFFNTYGLKYLVKPVPITELRDVVTTMTQRISP